MLNRAGGSNIHWLVLNSTGGSDIHWLVLNSTGSSDIHWLVLERVGSPDINWLVLNRVFDINQPGLPIPFYSLLVSISVFMTLLTVFHSISSPENSPLSNFVLPVLFLPHRSFQLYISLWKSLSALIIIILRGWLGLKHQLTKIRRTKHSVRCRRQARRQSTALSPGRTRFEPRTPAVLNTNRGKSWLEASAT